MKVSDLAQIEGAYPRFIQSFRFLRTLKETEDAAAEIRDRALLELEEEFGKPNFSQLARDLGVSQQRISTIYYRAKDRYGSS